MVARERNASPRRSNKVDSHGFPNENSGADLFAGIPQYKQDQENFDDLSWDDGTITTRGTTLRPSRPKLMPVNHASFRVDDNPFGYGDQDGDGAFGYEDHTPSRHTRSRRASVSGSVYTSTNHNSKRHDHHRRRGDETGGDNGDEGTSRHTRYRRRASLSCSVESSSDSKGADRPPRRSRRSSLSNVSEATPPLFTGDDILSSTTIDQGNGNRVCVVVVQLDNNGNPMDNNVLQQRGSDRQNSDRKSSERSRRRSGSGNFELHESTGKESRRAADPNRRSSEAKSGDRPRRRLSCNMGDTRESSRESSARPRRGGPSQGKSMREKDDHRGESDRPPRRSSVTHTNSNSSSEADRPRRRSSVTHTNSTSSSEDKGRPSEPSLRRRSSIGRAASNVSGSRSNSEKPEDSVTSGSGEGESSRHERKSSRRPSSKTLSLEDKASQSSDSKSKDRDSSGAKTKSRSSTKREGKQKSRDAS